MPGQNQETLGLTGFESYDVLGIGEDLQPGQRLTVCATDREGHAQTFAVVVRIDTPVEVNYYRNGGILQLVLRNMLKRGE